MFLHNFLMETIKEMIDSNVESFRIRQYALSWLNKKIAEESILTEADLMQIEQWLKEREEKEAEEKRLAEEEQAYEDYENEQLENEQEGEIVQTEYSEEEE